MKNINEYFVGEKNYYYNSWINGNKNHVITHLRMYATDSSAILYNSIISQFLHDPQLLKEILKRVSNSAGTFIDKTYL